MPKGGLEPPRVAPYAPQTYVSTSSTTSASSRKIALVENQLADCYQLPRQGFFFSVAGFAASFESAGLAGLVSCLAAGVAGAAAG